MTTTQQEGRTLPAVAVMLVFFVGVGAGLPVLPGAVREAGAGPTSLGVVLGVFPFAALLGRFLAGRLTDRAGRVFTLRVGLLVAAVAGVLLLLPVTVAGLTASRALHGVADALLYTAASAYVLDRTPEHRRPQSLSLLGAGIWGGYALGPLLGAFLDIRQVGVVVLVGAALGLVATAQLPESHVAGPPATGLRALLPRGVALPGISLGLGNLGYAVIVGFLVVHLDDRGARGAVALTCFSVAVLVGRLAVVPLAARIGILRTLPYGLVAMAAGLLVIGATSSTLVAGAAAAVVGLGYCLPFPALATLVAGRVPAAQRGAAIGALTAFYDVFVGIGSVAGGLVADRSGTPAVFVLAALGVLAAAAVNVALARRDVVSRPVVGADSAPDA
ncbi:MAG: major facilitator superfamily 1 [Frankiales bacterium]|nr:major facilitator superfamily 1 [Frankiales bacterium]